MIFLIFFKEGPLCVVKSGTIWWIHVLQIYPSLLTMSLLVPSEWHQNLQLKNKKSSVQPGGPIWSAAGSGDLGWSHVSVVGAELTDSGLWPWFFFTRPLIFQMTNFSPFTWQPKGSKCSKKGRALMCKNGSSVLSCFMFPSALFGQIKSCGQRKFKGRENNWWENLQCQDKDAERERLYPIFTNYHCLWLQIFTF